MNNQTPLSSCQVRENRNQNSKLEELKKLLGEFSAVDLKFILTLKKENKIDLSQLVKNKEIFMAKFEDLKKQTLNQINLSENGKENKIDNLNNQLEKKSKFFNKKIKKINKKIDLNKNKKIEIFSKTIKYNTTESPFLKIHKRRMLEGKTLQINKKLIINQN